uniref:Uncharacterized protein n=1 Tax=Helicotheca tamesis TaxID=374047 RepID=A0A7S2DZW9_9STRA|mmetsp:Transcript_10810/g.15052  ORF Transcript_10810/g.15052 Transcript_10810/m.15052 type:complete len:176 (+) Transcript_10810:43-570(+)
MPFDPRIDLPPLPSSRENALNEEIAQTDAEHVVPTEEGNDTRNEEKTADTTAPVEEAELLATPSPPTATETLVKEEKESEERRKQEERVFASHEPLPPSTTTSVINHFLSSTSRFVNAFVASADARLDSSTDKISALDVQISLLESKLSSIPGLDDDAILEQTPTNDDDDVGDGH